MQDQDTDETPNLNNLTIIHCDQDPHQGSKLSNTIIRNFSRGNYRFWESVHIIPDSLQKAGGYFFGLIKFQIFFGGS